MPASRMDRSFFISGYLSGCHSGRAGVIDKGIITHRAKKSKKFVKFQSGFRLVFSVFFRLRNPIRRRSVLRPPFAVRRPIGGYRAGKDLRSIGSSRKVRPTSAAKRTVRSPVIGISRASRSDPKEYGSSCASGASRDSYGTRGSLHLRKPADPKAVG